MNHCGIQVPVKNPPVLDPGFIPMGSFNRAYLSIAKKPVTIVVERADGGVARADTFLCGTADMAEADKYYVNRLTKTLLWMKGGFRIFVSGDRAACEYLREAFAPGGGQDFDYHHMSGLFEHPMEVVYTEDPPSAHDDPKPMGGHLDGCRIGFDAGGSDRKVSALLDGESVFSEEVVWFPKTNPDPDYHYDGIVSALKAAAAHLPRVDAVGVSSAGTYINNRTMAASLFLKVPQPLFDEKVRDIYIRAITDTFGDVPFEIINDGDVTALAGMMSLGEPNVLGIAMGTSQAGGFVDGAGRITGWLNELAFIPVDCQKDAMRDEWSLDIGCGVKYFSQDAVIKLAPRAGIELEESLPPAEKLKVVQELMKADDPRARDVYLTIGSYLGHSLPFYYDLYHMKHVLLLGRVMSGRGGEIILTEAKRVLADEYPEVSRCIVPSLPDEKFRRLGQSAAAASLPALKTE